MEIQKYFECNKFANANNIFFCIIAFDGGECKNIVNDYIQINENNMELAEDSQMIIFIIFVKNIFHP